MVKLSPEEATTRLETLRVEYRNWFNETLSKEHLEAILRKHLDRLQETFIDAYLSGSDAIQTIDLINFLNPSVKEIKDNENDSGGAPRKKGGRPSKAVDGGLGELGATHTDTRPGTDA